MVSVPPPTRGWSQVSHRLESGVFGSPAHAGMVRRSPTCTAPKAWFPRPRGDGPYVYDVRSRKTLVPPPTRGWSRANITELETRRGSPAHAGMVPGDDDEWGDVFGFPRPRGDGPVLENAPLFSYVVPPPTRGWSVERRELEAGGAGSPAHAGMVPGVRPCARSRARFPRPRGDGPHAAYCKKHKELVPPPTRGWSRVTIINAITDHGSPAHAGMVPSEHHAPDPQSWFPRPRGDGPCSCPKAAPPPRVPPPTRGWSAQDHDKSLPQRGSPAHAGMVPYRQDPVMALLRFPRPRGDGPLGCRAPPPRHRVPPPTRGWSQVTGRRLVADSGSPAHAGMVPGHWPPSRGRQRFPRPRGDGPRSRRSRRGSSRVPPPTRGWSVALGRQARDLVGSPAHAGMVRRRPSGPGACRRFPRPRGDGPLLDMEYGVDLAVPPPTRGWSFVLGPPVRELDGSPAHAGMVPSTRKGKKTSPRFPRPRGDGPQIVHACVRCVRVPPPTRGWSAEIRPASRSCMGSPAHAGMVPAPNPCMSSSSRFPRPRGDGPREISTFLEMLEVPPPTRGWSSLHHEAMHAVRGSPAHAGMVLGPR